jgi:hypothetical protein
MGFGIIPIKQMMETMRDGTVYTYCEEEEEEKENKE